MTHKQGGGTKVSLGAENGRRKFLWLGRVKRGTDNEGRGSERPDPTNISIQTFVKNEAHKTFFGSNICIKKTKKIICLFIKKIS